MHCNIVWVKHGGLKEDDVEVWMRHVMMYSAWSNSLQVTKLHFQKWVNATGYLVTVSKYILRVIVRYCFTYSTFEAKFCFSPNVYPNSAESSYFYFLVQTLVTVVYGKRDGVNQRCWCRRSIRTGVNYTFTLCLLCVSVWIILYTSVDLWLFRFLQPSE